MRQTRSAGTVHLHAAERRNVRHTLEGKAHELLSCSPFPHVQHTPLQPLLACGCSACVSSSRHVMLSFPRCLMLKDVWTCMLCP